MPTTRKKRVRGDEESEEEVQIAPDSARKRSRNVPASATKNTPSTRKSTRNSASDSEAPPSTRTSQSSRKSLSSVSQTIKLTSLTATKPTRPLTATKSVSKAKTPSSTTTRKTSTRKKPITPPSPLVRTSPSKNKDIVDSDEEEDYESQLVPTKPSDKGALDDRFALVDHNSPKSPTKEGGEFHQFVLPLVYLVCFVMLILFATGMAPGLSGSNIGRPSHVQDLLTNVTGHMKTHLSSLSSELHENNARLSAERISLNAISERLGLLEADEARVKQRLEDAIAKVDRLIWGTKNQGSSSYQDKPALSIVELESLQLTARDLEKKVRGHLENIAKTIVAEAKGANQRGGGALSESEVQKHYFEKWVEQSYIEMRPKDETYIPKSHTNALIKQYVQTFTEAECSGLHDFAGASNGARVFSASKTFGESSRSWLNPLASVPPTKSPDVAIRRGNEQGECWPMAGTQGSLFIELANTIHVGSITIMHIHPRLAPNGDVSSALKNFKVFAFPADGGEKFEILSNEEFDSTAGCVTFPVKGEHVASNGVTKQPVRRVALEVLSNHGRDDLTCIYRFMVHGQP